MEPDADTITEQAEPPSKLLAYVRLFRLPNVFTAVADVMMGYLFVRKPEVDPPQYLASHLAPLVLGSALMYMAGMVLNDVFDVEVDRAERPERPLPSGRIAVGWARWLGFEMLFFGAVLAGFVSFLTGDPRSASMAIALAVLIVLYNRVLKATFFGPIVMGGCRFLNVLLGMSVAGVGVPWTEINYVIAAGIGIYIVGVSWFARGEADDDIHRGPLIAGTLLIAVAMLLLAWFPYSHLIDEGQLVRLVSEEPKRWSLIWLILAATILWRCLRAIARPYALYVEDGVRHCLLSLITFDAVISFAQRDIFWSAAILVLVVPMTFLGRWSYST